MRPRPRISPTAWILVPAALLLVALVSCSRDIPVAPGASSDTYGSARALAASAVPSGAFFPLTVGNRWHAVGVGHITSVPTGGGPPFVELSFQDDISRELTGTETLLGRSYTLLTEAHVESGSFGGDPNPFTYWIRYRQDQSGLYEADVDVTQPPAASGGAARIAAEARGSRRALPSEWLARIPVDQVAAYERAWNSLQDRSAAVRAALGPQSSALRSAGLLDGEITRLSYPMRPGAQWTIRSDPFFGSTVEGVDNLDLPAGRFPAYRIRIEGEAFGSDDIVHFWFGRSGQLQAKYHLESVMTDVDGNEIGRLVDDYNEAVDQMTLLHP
jgi:hypothetical protein